MGCKTIALGNGQSAIVCSRGRRRELCDIPGCQFGCVALCDWPIPGTHTTCDKKLCVKHRAQIGPNRDYCPDHLKEAMAGQ